MVLANSTAYSFEKMIAGLLPFVVFFIQHFFLSQKMVKRENIKMSVCIALFSFLYGIAGYIYCKNLGNKLAVAGYLSFVPFFYVFNLLISRYVFFSSIFRSFFFKDKEPPFDPVIEYSGLAFGNSWEGKGKYKPYPIETIFSIWIIVVPCIICYLVLV